MTHDKQTVFISYSWSDAAFAQRVRSMVQAAGFQPWIDFERLDLERPLEPQLSRAISSTDWIIFLDSPHARSSRWVQLELELANQMRKPIVPLPIRRDLIARLTSVESPLHHNLNKHSTFGVFSRNPNQFPIEPKLESRISLRSYRKTYSSVTQPSEAFFTLLIYLYSVPRVALYGGMVH